MSNNPWENDNTDPNSVHQPPTGKNTSIAFWIIIGLLSLFTIIAFSNYKGGWLPENKNKTKKEENKTIFKKKDLHFAFIIPDIDVYKVKESKKNKGNIAANLSINKNVFITEYKLEEPITLTKKNYKGIWYQIVENASKTSNVKIIRGPFLVNTGKDNKIKALKGTLLVGKKKPIKNNLWFYFKDKAQVQINCQGTISKDCKKVLHYIYVPPNKK